MKKYWCLVCISICASFASATVSVSAPANGSTVGTPVQYVATATSSCSKGVSAMGIYTAPSVLAYSVNGASLNTSLTLNPGTYNTVVQEWDNCGGASTSAITITVSSGGGSNVKVTSPATQTTVSSPVSFVATATTSCSKGVAAMGIYTAPGVLAYSVNGASLNTSLSLSNGTYSTEVQEWDNCGGAAKSPVTITVSSGGSVPSSNHVFLVMEENHGYADVIGTSAMPYLSSLVQKYGLATHYYANTHPSIGNYFMITAGEIYTNDDSFCGVMSDDNIVRHLITAGKTWKSYAESLPSVGYTGCDVPPYLKRHNPFSYYSDVVDSSMERLNLVPFPQFATDLANNALPNFSYIAPNMYDDAHNGTLQQADAWLSTNIAPLLASPIFQSGGDGILIITFDESEDSDTQGGGGHVACLVIGPKVKPGYQSAVTYQHQNTLRTLMQALGFTSFPGAATTASPMSDFF
jgi:phosphatidylinositol-3-phosphatase